METVKTLGRPLRMDLELLSITKYFDSMMTPFHTVKIGIKQMVPVRVYDILEKQAPLIIELVIEGAVTEKSVEAAWNKVGEGKIWRDTFEGESSFIDPEIRIKK